MLAEFSRCLWGPASVLSGPQGASQPALSLVPSDPAVLLARLSPTAPAPAGALRALACRGCLGSSGGTKSRLPVPSTKAHPLVVFKLWW